MIPRPARGQPSNGRYSLSASDTRGPGSIGSCKLNEWLDVILFVRHLSEFDAAPELNETRNEILKAYLRKIAPFIETHFKRCMDLCGSIGEELLTLQKNASDGDDVDEMAELLVECARMLKPADEPDGEVSVSLESTSEWASRLEEAGQHAFVLVLLWSRLLLSQHPDE
jgi:hypothetical protein